MQRNYLNDNSSNAQSLPSASFVNVGSKSVARRKEKKEIIQFTEENFKKKTLNIILRVKKAMHSDNRNSIN